MKFGKDLATSMVKEWEENYCNYNLLKEVRELLNYGKTRFPRLRSAVCLNVSCSAAGAGFSTPQLIDFHEGVVFVCGNRCAVHKMHACVTDAENDFCGHSGSRDDGPHSLLSRSRG
jgi:hypothetical protein